MFELNRARAALSLHQTCINQSKKDGNESVAKRWYIYLLLLYYNYYFNIIWF